MQSNAWSWAAAILLVDGPLHYRELTEKVLSMGDSNLGRHGATPWQSLRKIMLKDHPHLFKDVGRRSGLYRVNEVAALRELNVRRALIGLLKRKTRELQDCAASLYYCYPPTDEVRRARKSSKVCSENLAKLTALLSQPV